MTELRFHVPLKTKQIISEMFPKLISYEFVSATMATNHKNTPND